MKITPARIVLIGAIVVIGLWLWYSQLSFGRTVEKWGVFGDKFGALNTLFTGLGFVGILATLYHQHREIQGSKDDLAQILKALADTTQALKEQGEQNNRQAYLTALIAEMHAIAAKVEAESEAGPADVLAAERDARLEELRDFLTLARSAVGAHRFESVLSTPGPGSKARYVIQQAPDAPVPKDFYRKNHSV